MHASDASRDRDRKMHTYTSIARSKHTYIHACMDTYISAQVCINRWLRLERRVISLSRSLSRYCVRFLARSRAHVCVRARARALFLFLCRTHVPHQGCCWWNHQDSICQREDVKYCGSEDWQVRVAANRSPLQPIHL